MLKKIVHNSMNFLLLAPFVMVLCTVFIVSRDLENGVVSGKYFWFYLSMILISINTIFSFFVNRKKVPFYALDVFVGLFCVSGWIITYLHNGSVSNKSIILLLLLLLYFYFRIFIGQYKWNAFVLVVFFISTGFVEAVWGLKQLYGFSPSQHTLFKTTGSFFNPGPYAGYLAMIMPLALYYILDDYRVFKNKFHHACIPFYLRWGISLLSFCSILLVLPATMSRAAWIGGTVGCLVASLTHIRHSWKRILRIMIVAFLLFTIGIVGLYYLKKDSADGRAFIWKISFQTIKDHPFGVGMGNFSGVYGEKQAEYFDTGKGTEREQLVAGNPEYAFNEYIQICIEHGIFSFILFISIIVYTGYIAAKRKKYAAASALIALLIFASMSYPFSVLPLLIALVFLMVSCLPSGSELKQAYSSRFIGILLIALFFISGVAIHNRYPLREAYQRWSKSKILYGVALYEEVNEEYAKLYRYLDHEIRFLFEYAQSLAKTNRYEESNGVLEKAMKISCDPMLYNVMGKNHQALGSYALAEQCFSMAATIVPSRLYPYYLLAKLYDEKGDGDRVCQMADFIQIKEAKVHSTAVEEIRMEMKSLCEKYKTE